MKNFSTVVFSGAFLGVLSVQAHADPASCPNAAMHITVQNLSNQMQEGYVMSDASSSFSLEPKQSREITIPATDVRHERHVEVFLSDSNSYQDLDNDETAEKQRCTGYIAVPDGCASDATAGRLYIYDTHDGHQCFVRTVAKAHRASTPIALKKW